MLVQRECQTTRSHSTCMTEHCSHTPYHKHRTAPLCEWPPDPVRAENGAPWQEEQEWLPPGLRSAENECSDVGIHLACREHLALR